MTAQHVIRWETQDRYMQASIQLDLLGDVVVVIAQGGLHSRRGMLRTVAVANATAGEAYIASLHKRRLRRGYKLVNAGAAATSREPAP
jgi:hypothetical protein